MIDMHIDKHENIIKGSVYALLAFFCMALFGIVTKIALQGASFFWVSFITYLTGALILLPRGIFELKSNHYPLLIGRALFGTLASLCYTISIQYIPIVNGTLLFNTAPIFIPLLGLIFLHENVKKTTWLAVLIGFIGIIVIIKPTEALFRDPGNLIGILSGISLAIAYLMMKLLSGTEPAVRIIFYYLGLGTLIQIPLLFLYEAPPLKNCLYAALAGVLLLTAQLALIKAYTYAKASEVGIYQYTSVVFVGLLDWLIWGVVPGLLEILGILLVAIAGMIIIRNGRPAIKTGH